MWPNSHAIKWMEGLLAARFGCTLLLGFDISSGNVRLSISGSKKHILFKVRSDCFPLGRSNIPCAYWNGDNRFHMTNSVAMPLIGIGELTDPLITVSSDGAFFFYDILGLVYWCLTRSEEVLRQDTDRFNRFPASSSHAFFHNYLDRPVVDEWLQVLQLVMEHLWPSLPLKQNEYSMQISHDVDAPARYCFSTPKQFLKSVAGELLIRKNIRAALKAPKLYFGKHQRIHPEDPLNTFDWIMDRSEEHGLKSAFYFICGRTSSEHDAKYDIDHPAIRQLIRRIHNRGHEVGLHPSFNSYLDPATIAQEANILKRVCADEGVFQEKWGGRMHYLRWRQPDTMRAWDAAGMSYDASLGYADHPGFRCGTCFEYQAFDPVAQNPLNLRIRPLVAMDVSVIAREYLGLGNSGAALGKFAQLSDACKKVGGTFSLLWHNCQLGTPASKILYQNILMEACR